MLHDLEEEQSFSRHQYSRGGAWRTVLDNKPKVTIGGYTYAARNHDFRKNHNATEWCWNVVKLALIGGKILYEPPTRAPVGLEFDWIWDVWREHDGRLACGWIAVGEVRPHNIEKEEADDTTRQEPCEA